MRIAQTRFQVGLLEFGISVTHIKKRPMMHKPQWATCEFTISDHGEFGLPNNLQGCVPEVRSRPTV